MLAELALEMLPTNLLQCNIKQKMVLRRPMDVGELWHVDCFCCCCKMCKALVVVHYIYGALLQQFYIISCALKLCGCLTIWTFLIKLFYQTIRIVMYFVFRNKIYHTWWDKEKAKRCNRSNNHGGKPLVIGVTSDRATLSMISPTLAF